MGEQQHHPEAMGWLTRLQQLSDQPKQLTELLSQAELLKVKVNKKKQSWVLELQFNGLVCRRQLNRLAESISDELAVNVTFSIHLSMADITLSQLCQNWDLLVEELCYHAPVLSSWAAYLDYKIDGDNLNLFLDNSIGVNYLQQKQIPSQLSKLLSKLLLRTVVVKLSGSGRADVDAGKLKQNYLSQVELPKPTPDNTDTAGRTKHTRKKGKTAPGSIKGKIINAQKTVQQIRTIKDEEKEVVIFGQIFSVDVRQFKSERCLVSFDITDETDSISVKAFAEKDEQWVDNIIKGAWVKVRGSVQYDRYTQELTVFCNDINEGKAVIRWDQADEKRVELHLHTKLSALDAVTDIEASVATAARWGHPAVAITDHGVVQAFPEAYDAGEKHGVKIIYGVEAYLVDDRPNNEQNKRYHIIILVENMQGLENLYRLISASHLQHFYRKPLVTRSLIEQFRPGLLLGSACEAGELIQAYLKGADPAELETIASWYDYLEIQPTGNNLFLVRQGIVPDEDYLRKMNSSLVELGRKLAKPVVATGDVHFLEPGHSIYREILMSGQGFNDVEQPPLYFRTTDEMLGEFAYLGEETAREVVLTAPTAIANKVEKIRPIPENLHPPEIPGADKEIIEMATGSAEQLYGKPLPSIVQSRLDKELDAIISNDFAVLYLIAHKLVKQSNQDGYLVGSRGSVGSSFVATMTGITEVNPLPPHYRCQACGYNQFIEDGSCNSGADLADKDCPDCGQALLKDGHDIPFEVFLGFKGDKVPDIDLNFSGDYQPRAHRFTEELFGKEFVFRAGTIATIAERTAYGFVKGYFNDKNQLARNAEINRLVQGITGVKRTTGQHPGGLMVVPQHLNIHKFSPIQRPADDTSSQVTTTHFDYHAISSRLVKLDILGHDDPTVIKMLEDLTGVDAQQVPLDEPKTMSLFSSVDALAVTTEDIRSQVGTFGIPEFGTRFVRQMLVDTKPAKFSDLVRISGLSHGTDVWLNNAQDLLRQGITTISEVISTRDDIMVFLIYKGLPADLSFKIMEDVRKGKGLKPEYVEKMLERDVPQWYVDSCNKIKYMFPKAHAVAYVTMAYRIAFFKVYYPQAFYTTFFTVRADQFDAQLICQGREAINKEIEAIEAKGNNLSQKEKSMLTIFEVALEMYCRGIKLLPVDLEASHQQDFRMTANGILVPFAGLQGVGGQVATNIVAAREEKPFSSIEDLKVRGRVSTAVTDILAEHGTLKHLPQSDQMALF